MVAHGVTPVLPIAEQKFPRFQGIFGIFRGTSNFLLIYSKIPSGPVVGEHCIEQTQEDHTFTLEWKQELLPKQKLYVQKHPMCMRLGVRHILRNVNGYC